MCLIQKAKPDLSSQPSTVIAHVPNGYDGRTTPIVAVKTGLLRPGETRETAGLRMRAKSDCHASVICKRPEIASASSPAPNSPR